MLLISLYFSRQIHSGSVTCSPSLHYHIPQARVQDLLKGGPQVLRLKVDDIAKRSHASEASKLQRGSRACLRALEAFGFLMLKYAFSHILETLSLSFLTSISTLKVDKIEHYIVLQSI